MLGLGLMVKRGWMHTVDLPNMDAGGSRRESQETFKTELCLAKGQYGVQIPKGAWHTIEFLRKIRFWRVKKASINHRETT